MRRRNGVWLLVFIVITCGIIFSGVAQAGWQPDKNHWPRLIYGAADLKRINDRIASGHEPYKTLWQRIQDKANKTPVHGSNDWKKEYENANIAKNKAFVYAVTKDITKAQEAWDALLKMKYDAKWWDSKDIQDSIYMAQSLTAHCQAYDILRGAGYCPASNHGKVRENLSKLTDNLYQIGQVIFLLITNYQLKITSSVGIAAITLNTEDLASKWINWSMTKFWQVFQSLTTDEGGYAEGPSYLLYSAVNYLPFMRAYNLFMDGQGGEYEGGSGKYWVPNFLSDPRVKAVHDWGVKIRMPNGTRPGFDDSYYEPFINALLATSADTSGHDTDHVPGTSTNHYAWDWYSYESLPQAPGERFFSDYNVDLSIDVLCAFDANILRWPPDLRPTQIMLKPGTAIFRDHWGKEGTYMLFLGEYGSMIAEPLSPDVDSHEHPDNASIVLYSHGELLALDTGYIDWERRGETNRPDDHNMVTIEGNLSNVIKYPSGYIDLGFDIDFMGYAEVLTSIDVKYNDKHWTQPSSVDYRRSVLFPNHRYFVIVDALNPKQISGSRQYHAYHWRLHGNGMVGGASDSPEGSYTHLDGQGGMWTRKNGKLIALVTTDHDAPEITHNPGTHSLQWQEPKTHEFLMAKKEVGENDPRYDARFLSVLYPTGTSDPFPSISSLNISDAAGVKITEPTEEGGMVGIAMTKGNWNEIMIPKSNSGVGDIKTNARILFTQVNSPSNEMNLLFAKDISKVNYEGKSILSVANWIDSVSLGFSENKIFGVLVFADGYGKPYFDIQTDWKDPLVMGLQVSKWQSLGGGLVRIWLSESGGFAIYNKVAMTALGNPSFTEHLNYWWAYGDGDDYEATMIDGKYAATIKRSEASGNYLELNQKKIPCEPNTTYRLTLWVKTEADSGYIAGALGNWGSLNTHKDFGFIGGHTGWKQISGSWTSRGDETLLDIVLFGSMDFSGKAYFSGLVLEKVWPPLEVTIHGPSSLGYKKAGTYTANVSKGSGDYRYQWYKKMDGNDHWARLGTQQTQVVTMINKGFTLRVDVHDNITEQNASTIKYVEYEENIKKDEEVEDLR